MLLSKEEKRKYAQAMRRIELGVFGYKKSLFRAVHLTTREGNDNTPECFKKDFRELIKWIRSLGYKIEYCCAVGFTPGKGLVHLHGLLRIKRGFLKLYEGARKSCVEYKGSDGKVHSEHIDANRRALGDKWNEIHGAFVVLMDKVRKETDFQEYINKHMLKDYAKTNMVRNSFLVSKGWRRNVPVSFVKEIKDWYRNGAGLVWLDRKGWKIINQAVKARCEKINIIVKVRFGYLIIEKGKIKEAVMYGFGEEGEKV